MAGLPSSFGSSDDDLFDPKDAFVPDHLPDPGPFLEGHTVLTDQDHVDVHATTREVFEERKVYDMTFNYNLARLNRDTRHPDAGYRYAIDRDGAGILRAEFTPTTPFCPQTHTLTIGSFRAWNGLSEHHDYDLVRVRVAPMHHQSDTVNEHLETIEKRFRKTGSVDTRPSEESTVGDGHLEPNVTDAPF